MNQISGEQIVALRSAFAEGLSLRKAAAKCDVNRETVLRYYAQFRDEKISEKKMTAADTPRTKCYRPPIFDESWEHVKKMRVGMRVIVNDSALYGRGRTATITSIPSNFSERLQSIGVRFDDGEYDGETHWHVSYFDPLPTE